MGDKNFLVSICVPAYNCRRYVEDTLRCLCSQTYPNIEIIVINDGSTDDTAIKIENIKDNKIKLITVKNGGAAKARNTAFKNSNGELVVFFDTDDIVDKDYLLNQIKAFNGEMNSVVSCQWARFYNDDLTNITLVPNPKHPMNLKTWVEEFWYQVNPMTNPGRFLIPRNIIENAGLWNEELKLNDDMEFFTRIFDNSASIIFNDESILYYRSGISSLSGTSGELAYRSLYMSIKLSTEIVLKKYPNTLTQKACANMWQSFIYTIYPSEKSLLKLAEKELHNLAKSNFKYPSGGLTQILIKLIGWKLTHDLKNLILL